MCEAFCSEIHQAFFSRSVKFLISTRASYKDDNIEWQKEMYVL
jgi:hypothetical protein